MPVPDKITFCDAGVALSVMVTVPAFAPVPVGVNVTPIVQEVFGASWPVQLLESA